MRHNAAVVGCWGILLLKGRSGASRDRVGSMPGVGYGGDRLGSRVAVVAFAFAFAFGVAVAFAVAVAVRRFALAKDEEDPEGGPHGCGPFFIGTGMSRMKKPCVCTERAGR